MKTSSHSLNKASHVRKLTAVGLFCALAYVCCVVFHFKASFLTFDLKDAVMSVGAMIFGPVYALVMAFIVTFIEAVTISSTGIYGFIMNFLSSSVFVGVGSLIYTKKRTIGGAVLGVSIASAFTVGVMMLANLLITPFYMNVPRADVAAMIPTLLLPFNITKVIFNSAVVFIIYKPIITAMRASGFLSAAGIAKPGEESKPRRKMSIVITITAFLAAAAALVYFYLYLNGSVSFR